MSRRTANRVYANLPAVNAGKTHNVPLLQMSNRALAPSLVLKQRQLLRPEHGRTKQRQIVSEALALIEPEPRARSSETLRQQLRVLALAALARAEARIVVAAAAHGLQTRHHVLR